MNRKLFVILCLVAGLLMVSLTVSGESFPSKALTIIVPWGVGGGTDTVARLVARITEKYVDVPVKVENKTGGGGAIGFRAVRMAKADGYTLCMGAGPLTSLKIFKDIDINYENYTPVAQVWTAPATLVIRNEVKADNLREFVEYARQNKVKLGMTSPGATWWVAAQLIKKETGIKTIDVIYEKGAATMLRALLAGEIDAGVVSISEAHSLLQGRELKCLAITSPERTQLYPVGETFVENGFKVIFEEWRGLIAPLEVPAERIKKLEEIFAKVVNDEQYIDFMTKNKQGMAYRNSAEFKEFIEQDARNKQMLKKLLNK